MKELFQNIFVRFLVSATLFISLIFALLIGMIQEAEKEALDNSLEKLNMIAEAKIDAFDQYHAVLETVLGRAEKLILHESNDLYILSHPRHQSNKIFSDETIREWNTIYGVKNIVVIGMDRTIKYTLQPTKANDDQWETIPNNLFVEGMSGETWIDSSHSAQGVVFALKTIQDGIKPIGIIAAEIDLKKIHSILQGNSALQKSGEMILGTLNDGHIDIIASSRGTHKDLEGQYTDLTETMAKALNGEVGSGYIVDGGQKSVGAVWKNLPLYGWALVFQMDKSEMLKSWHAHQQMMMVFFGIGILVLLVIMLYLYRLLVAPLKKLADYALILKKGDYDVKIECEEGNEFDLLAKTLKSMALHIREDISQFQSQNQILQKQKEQIETLNVNLEIEIDEKTKQLKEYIEIIDHHVITSSTDKDGVITYASDAFCDISGYKREELLGKKHRIVRHKDMDSTLFKEMWETISEGKVWGGEIKNRKKDGSYYWVYTVITPNYVNGDIIGYTAVRQDITAQKINEELVITDALTGLYNRRHFNEIMEKEILRARRSHIPLALLMIDVDYFKYYNDFYGHLEGDGVLVKVASIIQKSIARAGDYPFRLGGEEFGILLTSMDFDNAVQVAEAIRTAIEQEGMPHQSNQAASVVTISIGVVSLVPDEKTDMKTLYKMADEQLYQAKESGRNRVAY